MTARPLVTLAAWLLLVGVPGGVVTADRQAAGFYTQRGDKALKEKKWDDAAQQYRKALEEDDANLPARFGLGEALFGAGDRAAAVDAWRRAVAAGLASPLPAGWGEVAARAKKRLAEVDQAGTELDAMLDKQVESLLALSSRWATKDPAIAARALREALAIRPGQARAAAALQKLDRAGATAVASLFSGKDLSGWVGATKPTWEVSEGLMVGDAADGTVALRSESTLKGDFDVRLEAKLVETREGLAGFLLCGAVKGESRCTGLGILGAELVLREEDGDAQRNVFALEPGKAPKPFDPKEWTTYELRFRGHEVQAFVNGDFLASRERQPTRDEGAVAIVIQKAKILCRKVEALRR